MFSPVPTTPGQDWILAAALGLLIGPCVLLIAAGKPEWVRYVAWAQMALLALVVLRNILTPVPVFGTFVIIYLLVLGLLVLALAAGAKFLAGLVRRHVWRVAAQPEKQIK
ncbi:hypothetical protein [Pseudoponticoccus marisrubri]|nr:hypothetical protein [Pseudoponticoccus marisrubri]